MTTKVTHGTDVRARSLSATIRAYTHSTSINPRSQSSQPLSVFTNHPSPQTCSRWTRKPGIHSVSSVTTLPLLWPNRNTSIHNSYAKAMLRRPVKVCDMIWNLTKSKLGVQISSLCVSSLTLPLGSQGLRMYRFGDVYSARMCRKRASLGV